MKNKVLILGLNPSRKGKKSPAWNRLMEWIDDLDLPVFSFANLSCDPDWDMDVHKLDRDYVHSCSVGYNKVIALGNGVSSFLDKLGIDHFKLPHPSPRNRQLNDPLYIGRKIADCRDYLYG